MSAVKFSFFLFLIVMTALGQSKDPKPNLWHNPGPVEAMNLAEGGAGTATVSPKPPFYFVREEGSGNSPKVFVKDSAGALWRMKGGPEARAEAFATRIVSAMGYYVEPWFFYPQGKVEGLSGELGRASGFLRPDGSFTYASLELASPAFKYLPGDGWNWEDSPHAGSKELNGLKVLVMLLSNWDNKDSRDKRKGSNTSTLETTENGVVRQYMIVNDWGQSLGSWGGFWTFFGGREPWNCSVFQEQSPLFVLGKRNGFVQFGYGGQHTTDFKAGIAVADVSWLLIRLGRISDSQLAAGLQASGASEEETRCYVRALRARIDALQKAAAPAGANSLQ